MRYILLTAVTPEMLAVKVSSSLIHGWQLYASPFYTPASEHCCDTYGQAMTHAEV